MRLTNRGRHLETSYTSLGIYMSDALCNSHLLSHLNADHACSASIDYELVASDVTSKYMLYHIKGKEN